MTRSFERLSQHDLALELRAAIDATIRDEGLTRSLKVGVAAAARARTRPNIQRIRDLIEEHPRGYASKHVRHNLSKNRLAWLRSRGMLVDAQSFGRLNKTYHVPDPDD